MNNLTTVLPALGIELAAVLITNMMCLKYTFHYIPYFSEVEVPPTIIEI